MSSKSDLALSVRGVSKAYVIAHGAEKHTTAGEAMMHRLKNPLQKVEREEFWALNDVNFDINKGETVGIIGGNGAGKSTLLKVLSQITEPTKGVIDLYGRVGSLLEVGTGFHAELTGRENIYLNGSILGMRKREIAKQFDAIVDFSGVEKFLDTPVKRYSSGMYVRLAFAVAAHLQSEILIVDEVLAVGDAAFQRKCLGKMQDVANQGRTVLFVSHNMALVQTLCKRGILLSKGSVMVDDAIDATASAYLQALETAANENVAERLDRGGNGKIRLTNLSVLTCSNPISPVLVVGQPARIIFQFDRVLPGMICTATIYDQHGQRVTVVTTSRLGPNDVELPDDSAISDEQDGVGNEIAPYLVCEIDEMLLMPGRYRLNIQISVKGEVYDHLEAAAVFDVEPGQVRGRSITAHSGHGSVHLPHRWDFESPMDATEKIL